MQQYKDLISKILYHGFDRGDRTGVGTKAIFGHSLRFDLNAGFPIVTVKKTWWRGIKEELAWMLMGKTNVNEISEDVRKIWIAWADENGELGPTYGASYRHFRDPDTRVEGQAIDQLRELIEGLKKNPTSRRHLITLWNPLATKNCKLPPCHGTVIQFFVTDNKLSCSTYQRSADVFLGLPFNIASYALLTHILAAECGYEVGELYYTLGDAHIYKNHIDQCVELLIREPLALPKLLIKGTHDMFPIDMEKYTLEGYKSHGKLIGDVAV